MMFHLTNSMFKTAMPNMNDVLKQNPDLVKNMMNAVKNTQQRAAGVAPEDPTQRPASPVDIRTGRREMKGPGLDISSLMGGIMMPPMMPMNTRVVEVIEEEDDNDSVSDIVSISGESTGGEVREVKIAKPRKSKKKMNEVTL